MQHLARFDLAAEDHARGWGVHGQLAQLHVECVQVGLGLDDGLLGLFYAGLGLAQAHFGLCFNGGSLIQPGERCLHRQGVFAVVQLAQAIQGRIVAFLGHCQAGARLENIVVGAFGEHAIIFGLRRVQFGFGCIEQGFGEVAQFRIALVIGALFDLFGDQEGGACIGQPLLHLAQIFVAGFVEGGSIADLFGFQRLARRFDLCLGGSDFARFVKIPHGLVELGGDRFIPGRGTRFQIGLAGIVYRNIILDLRRLPADLCQLQVGARQVQTGLGGCQSGLRALQGGFCLAALGLQQLVIQAQQGDASLHTFPFLGKYLHHPPGYFRSHHHFNRLDRTGGF